MSPGPTVENQCTLHPDEPLTGLCGCGTFFCRKCSPSRVFCHDCADQRNLVIHHNEVAHSQNGTTAARTVDTHRPLSQRVILESLIMTLMLVGAIWGLFTFWGNGQAYSDNDHFVTYGINSSVEPTQRQAAFFKSMYGTVGGAEVTLTSDTVYSVSAKVQSITAYDDSMGDAIPYDLLLAWGSLAEGDVDGKLSWMQSDRRGTVSGSLSATGADVDADYVISHVSNSHVLPANQNIAVALDTIKTGDIVRIDGRLVDVKLVDGNQVYNVESSKSRTDQGDGACEIILVERIKINEETWS